MPPVAAVYVNVIVFPLVAARTLDVPDVSVPEPSGAFVTVIDGEEASAAYEPPDVDFSWLLHVCAPVVVVATPFE